MSKLDKTIAEVHKQWNALPVETRNQILYKLAVAFKSMKDAQSLASEEFLNSLVVLFKVGAQASLMPFGPGFEGVVIKIAQSIPALSPYVQKLIGD